MDNILGIIKQIEHTTSWDEEKVLALLYKGVSQLLEHDLPALFQVLYRIDVKEAAVRLVFEAGENSPDIAEKLSFLILQRIKEKVALRKKYSSGNAFDQTSF